MTIPSKLYAIIPALLLLSTELAAQAPATPKKSGNPVADAFAHAGIIGWCIVGVSVLSLALIIENFMTLKRDKIAPPDLIDELEALFDEENFQEALELCENERSYLTNVVAAGLGRLGHSFDTIQISVREMEDEESVKLFQKVGYLSLIAATAPMMGLLGTVTGMFVTFGDIALLSSQVVSSSRS
jgi:biopolymer transport protein ExbB